MIEVCIVMNKQRQ